MTARSHDKKDYPLSEHTRMPVTLVFITFQLMVGGAERQLYYLIRELDKSRYSVYVVPLFPGDDMKRQFEAAGATIVPIYKRPGFDPTVVVRLRRFLRRIDPDIVHCQMYTANIWGRIAAVLAGCKRIVVSERNSDELWKTRFHFVVERFLNKYATVYLGNSRRVCQYCEDNLRLPPGTYRLMHNGVDTSEFRPLPSQSRPPRTGFVVGTVANIAPRKDLSTFLRMAALVLERFPQATFKIIGHAGPEKASLLELAAELGITARVEFTIKQDNVNAAYHTFDVFVLGSAHEGFANVIVEAMASGLPVVATRVGAAPEVIEEGLTGFMVPPRDPELLAERVGRLLADPSLRETMGHAGYVRVIRDFSLQSMVARYDELYGELMTSSSLVRGSLAASRKIARTT